MHAHFDCFSGAAGDMMLAACLDAANSLPYSLVGHRSSIAAEGGQESNLMNSDVLLSILVEDLEGGLPELKGEFELSVKRVWRGMGRIAAMKVDVDSVYRHEAAPVPGAPQKVHESYPCVEHNHQCLKDDPLQYNGEEYNHYHQGYSHNHEPAHSHHDHTHNHVNSSANYTEGVKEEPQHDSEHNHSHGHSHNDGHSRGKLRNLPQITNMLQSAPSYHIPTRVATLAIEAFTTLAHAEMHTHGATSINEVHFHEVGAVDSIVDTVGTLLALHYLGVNLGGGGVDESGDDCVPVAVTCSPLPLGEGNVWTDHGLLPVPAFAAMRLMIGMPTCPGPKGVTGELVTPTAAALLRVLTGVSSSDSDGKKYPGLFWQPKEVPGRPPFMIPRAVGIGAGSKDFERHPNVMRLILGDVTHQTQSSSGSIHNTGDALEVCNSSQDIVHVSDIPVKMQTRDEATNNDKQKCLHLWEMHTLTLLQANIDDATPELLAHAVNLLLDNGAIDAWISSIVMKKGRPAHSLNCMLRCNSADEERLLTILFRNTTSLGVRIQRNVLRAALRRKIVKVQLPYADNVRNGEVDVKISSLTDGEVVSVKAEFDQCKVVSLESGVPLKIVSSMAERLAWDRYIAP